MPIRSSDHFYPRSPILSEKLRASWDSHRHAIKIMSYRNCTTNCKRLSRDWSYQSQPRTWSSSSYIFCCLFPLDAGHMVYIYIYMYKLSYTIQQYTKMQQVRTQISDGWERRTTISASHLVWRNNTTTPSCADAVRDKTCDYMLGRGYYVDCLLLMMILPKLRI